MKKFIAIVAIATLASCGGSATTETTTNDSTVIKADTTKVVDFNTVETIKVDSVKKVK